MRLTIRVLLSMMNALECSLDELTMKFRGSAYQDKINSVRKNQRATRRELAEIMDAMIDSNDAKDAGGE
jgi:hypothetical protein